MQNYPFEVYQKYLSIKFHYEGRYDYWKYYGKISHSINDFKSRNDYYHFIKFSEKYKNIDFVEDFFISNYMYGENYYIIDMRTPEARKIAHSWEARMKNILYHFENDILFLQRKHNKPLKDILSIRNNYPYIIEDIFQKEIYLETLIILDMIFSSLIKTYMKNYDDIIWNHFCDKFLPFSSLCQKYLSKNDKKTFAKIIKKCYS